MRKKVMTILFCLLGSLSNGVVKKINKFSSNSSDVFAGVI